MKLVQEDSRTRAYRKNITRERKWKKILGNSNCYEKRSKGTDLIQRSRSDLSLKIGEFFKILSFPCQTLFGKQKGMNLLANDMVIR
jgi:hypothetical protein